MHYRTRHLVALREFAHGDSLVREGDPLVVTPTDAEHYLTRKMAREVAAPAPAASSPPPAPAPTTPASSPTSGGEIRNAPREASPVHSAAPAPAPAAAQAHAAAASAFARPHAAAAHAPARKTAARRSADSTDSADATTDTPGTT